MNELKKPTTPSGVMAKDRAQHAKECQHGCQRDSLLGVNPILYSHWNSPCAARKAPHYRQGSIDRKPRKALTEVKFWSWQSGSIAGKGL
jgi:hypothetical protein